MVKRGTDEHGLPLILKTEEIAVFLDVRVTTVRKWLAAGLIPSKKVGKRRFVRRKDFLDTFDPKKRRRSRRSRP